MIQLRCSSFRRIPRSSWRWWARKAWSWLNLPSAKNGRRKSKVSPPGVCTRASRPHLRALRSLGLHSSYAPSQPFKWERVALLSHTVSTVLTMLTVLTVFTVFTVFAAPSLAGDSRSLCWRSVQATMRNSLISFLFVDQIRPSERNSWRQVVSGQQTDNHFFGLRCNSCISLPLWPFNPSQSLGLGVLSLLALALLALARHSRPEFEPEWLLILEETRNTIYRPAT